MSVESDIASGRASFVPIAETPPSGDRRVGEGQCCEALLDSVSVASILA